MAVLDLNNRRWRQLTLNGGRVEQDDCLRLYLPTITEGYGNAQVDDYGAPHIRRRADYPWQPRVTMTVRARFSHENGRFPGTAGFGFWNAPFGDPTVRWPALPQAVWFFYAAPPNNLPLPVRGPGRGWFVATIDATRPVAYLLAPLAPIVLLLNQVNRWRHHIWPWLRRQLRISFAPLPIEMTAWHTYQLIWAQAHCAFYNDGRTVLQTDHAPRGPLGFVCWIDNQYVIATPRGRLGWGTTTIDEPQWLELADLQIETTVR